MLTLLILLDGICDPGGTFEQNVRNTKLRSMSRRTKATWTRANDRNVKGIFDQKPPYPELYLALLA